MSRKGCRSPKPPSEEALTTQPKRRKPPCQAARVDDKAGTSWRWCRVKHEGSVLKDSSEGGGCPLPDPQHATHCWPLTGAHPSVRAALALLSSGRAVERESRDCEPIHGAKRPLIGHGSWSAFAACAALDRPNKERRHAARPAGHPFIRLVQPCIGTTHFGLASTLREAVRQLEPGEHGAPIIFCKQGTR